MQYCTVSPKRRLTHVSTIKTLSKTGDLSTIHRFPQFIQCSFSLEITWFDVFVFLWFLDDTTAVLCFFCTFRTANSRYLVVGRVRVRVQAATLRILWANFSVF